MGPGLIPNARFDTDKRKLAGVLLAISITVCFFPTGRLAPLINGNGGTVNSGIQFAALMGNLIAFAMGILGGALAWAELVHDYGNANITFGISIFEILAFVPYITDIVMIGKAANTGKAFIPPMYNPSSGDVWFVGVMGMLGAGTFCLFLFGSYALLVMSIYEYQRGNPQSRNARYYRGRLAFYSAVMAIAGLAQLMLGAFVLNKYGGGPLKAPVVVAMFVVFFPEISVFVGLVFVVNGLWGIMRGMSKPNDHYFAFSMFFQYLCTQVMMVCTQTWWAPAAANNSHAPPTLSALTLGVSLIPTFLDYLGRTMPEETTQEYYYGDQNESAALTKGPQKSVGVEQAQPTNSVTYEEDLLEDVHV